MSGRARAGSAHGRRRRGALRQGDARALLHRRQRLPDRAARRGPAALARRRRAAVVRIAARHGVSITPRGGGTSQAGQAIGAGLVLDTSKYLNRAAGGRPGRPRRPGRARRGARRAEPPRSSRTACASPPTCQLVEPRHRGRHDGQQLERRALGALRQDRSITCDRSSVVLADGAAARLAPLGAEALAAASRAATSILARAYRELPALARTPRRRDRSPLPQGAAPRRRLQPRRVRRSRRRRSICRA